MTSRISIDVGSTNKKSLFTSDDEINQSKLYYQYKLGMHLLDLDIFASNNMTAVITRSSFLYSSEEGGQPPCKIWKCNTDLEFGT